jgi:hypothetical protein
MTDGLVRGLNLEWQDWWHRIVINCFAYQRFVNMIEGCVHCTAVRAEYRGLTSRITRQSSQATQPSIHGRPSVRDGWDDMLYWVNLSPASCLSLPETLPTVKARSVCDLQGMFRAIMPVEDTCCRVYVALSMTTAILGGTNSTGMHHAAAMTFRLPSCIVLTRTVGPWLIRRLACLRSTVQRIGIGFGSTVLNRRKIRGRR